MADPNKGAHAGRAQQVQSQKQYDDKRRRKFIGCVLAVAIVFVAGFLVWDTNLRPYSINAKDFPSDGLRAAVRALDADGDGLITREEAADITELTVTEGTNVSGLSILPNLSRLIIDSDSITSVDVSEASSLVALDAKGSASVDDVNLGRSSHLKQVDLSGTSVDSLDLSGVTLLENLCLADTYVESLSLSGLGSLSSLDVTGTSIQKLDLADQASLSTLRCANSVKVENLSKTPLSAYWLVTDFKNNIPMFAGEEGQKVHATAVYDELNRLSSATFTEGSATAPATVSYSYDDDGRLTKVSFADMQTSSSAPTKNSWSLSYDDEGRLSEASCETGAYATYTYDDKGRLSTYGIKRAPKGLAAEYSFEYDDNGFLSAIACGDERTEFAYDTSGRVTSIAVTAPKSQDSSDETDSESKASASDSSSAASSSASSSSASSGVGKEEKNKTVTDDSREVLASYTLAYDSEGNCVRVNYAINDKDGQGEETVDEKFTYDDGVLANAMRVSSGEGSDWYLDNKGIVSSEFSYDEEGNLIKAVLTRQDRSEGSTDSIELGYTRVFATKDTLPKGSIWSTSYPLAVTFDDDGYLASLVASGSSEFTPWACAPDPLRFAFDGDAALPMGFAGI